MGGDIGGDSAMVKVRSRLASLFADLPGAQVFVDRSEDEPIREEERPCVVLRIVDVQFDTTYGQAEMRHNCTLDMDFYETSLTFGGISAALSSMLADANALIAADRSLGGMLESFEVRSATAELDATPDLGCAILTAELTFLTPRADWTTILGVSGTF